MEQKEAIDLLEEEVPRLAQFCVTRYLTADKRRARKKAAKKFKKLVEHCETAWEWDLSSEDRERVEELGLILDDGIEAMQREGEPKEGALTR